MFNPFGSGLLTTNLGSAQSAFHPVHSPVCRNSSSVSPRGRPSPDDNRLSTDSPSLDVGGVASPTSSRATLLNLEAPAPSAFEASSSTPTSPACSSPGGVKRSSSSLLDAQSSGICQICADRATGKHYGANSCDGCKGFFRRTIRKDQNYICRFDQNCVIDKDKRNTCRYCRFKKCTQAGMRREAVQNERDRIRVKRFKSEDVDEKVEQQQLQPVAASTSNASASNSDNQQRNYLILIQQAEVLYSQLRSTVITTSSTSSPTVSTEDSASAFAAPRLATVTDLAEAIKQQLLLLVEWAKALTPFYELSLDDQVSLLRAYAAEHLLLGVARRSLPYRDVLLLSNDACIPRSHSSEIHDVNHVVFRILDELVEPMRELQLDDAENGCLKALLFFNPSAFGLHNRQKVKETRQCFLEAFCEYVKDKSSNMSDKVRFGNLLLLLPPLQAMSQQFVEDLQLVTLFGVATFDKLLEELLLASAEPLTSPFLVDGINAVAIKMKGGKLLHSISERNSPATVVQHSNSQMDVDDKKDF